ncbi:MAG: CarD family transcriptional regulator [Anaerovoracaceae bacterium]
MFAIGDKVVYPMHGAGTIEALEEKEILGETHQYYVLKLPYDDMKVMVPVDNTGEVGIRNIVSEEEMERVLESLRGESTEMPSNWNHRYRANMDKLKSGDIFQVADVVRNLGRIEKKKKLSTGEKKLFTNAKQILLSEVILIKKIGQKEANDLIESAL